MNIDHLSPHLLKRAARSAVAPNREMAFRWRSFVFPQISNSTQVPTGLTAYSTENIWPVGDSTLEHRER